MKALRLPVPHALRLMVSPAGSTGSCLFVSAHALPATRRSVAGPGSLLVTLAIPFQRFSSWARTGPHRFPGDPSRGSAPFQDPGRPVAPRLMRCFRCCPQAQHTKGVVDLHDFEAYRAASPPAVYASRQPLPAAVQDSLPAGGLRLCRAGVEPAGSRRKVSVHVIPLSRAYPVASWSHGRRKFYELADIAAGKRRGKRAPPVSPLALEAVTRIDVLFDIERTIRGETAERRLAVRREQSAPLLAELEGVDAHGARRAIAPRRRGQGDGLHAEALGRLRPLPRRRPYLSHQ